jgi:hypothetical protein
MAKMQTQLHLPNLNEFTKALKRKEVLGRESTKKIRLRRTLSQISI